MKCYAMIDRDLRRESPIGILFSYDKADTCVIELADDVDAWDAPLLFQRFVQEGQYTISSDIAMLWVQERIIPSGRQNIGEILKNSKLSEYREMPMLIGSRGKSAQDNCYLKEIDMEEIPEPIKRRRQTNLMECFLYSDQQLVCILANQNVLLVSLEKLLVKNDQLKYMMHRPELLASVHVDAGGYGILFSGGVQISKTTLLQLGEVLPIDASFLEEYVSQTIVDSFAACEILECSRQNLSYLVNAGKIRNVTPHAKEGHYQKGELYKLKYD